jgi:O-antigen ligase
MLHSSLRRWSVALFLMLLVVSGTLMFGYIQEAWVNFNAYRQGSSDLRMLIYSMSWDIAMEQGPYIGLGVKPREEYLVPIGSHSTLVGSVLKTGLFGFLFLLLFYMSIFLRALKYIFYGKSEGVLLGMACLVLMVYSGFADVDAPQLVSFLFFMIIGMLFRRESYERNI